MQAPLDLHLVISTLRRLRLDFSAGSLFFLSLRDVPRQTRFRLQHPSCRRLFMDQNDVVSVLEDLIETSKDGQKGYQDAAEHAKRSDLKTFFNQQSLERARFAGELEAELPRMGEPDKKVSGSASGAMHRAWIDTKVALGGGDKTILESVEAGEDKAKEAYQKALGASLPANVLEIVRRQGASVQKAHDEVKRMRDAAKAAA
ncbi:MAG TPA: PA2169 family four-helix-bundle protein [Candidatus Binatia bacterium]|nr:PA2169 family four-helix-bundle protein [Candidatus Binatia bacterium]